jgi:FKBP-type peptidyl-prolyl cis-trans isomerase FkpA
MTTITFAKITSLLSFALLPMVSVVSGQVSGQPGLSGPGAEAEVSPEKILETYGFIVGLQSGLRDFDLTEEEFATFLRGLNRAQAGEAVPTDIDQILPQLQNYLGTRQAAVVESKARQNRAQAAQFFAELQEDEEVESTPEGLFYRVVEEGTGERPDPTSMVLVHYEGRLLDGTVFDSSIQRGAPAEFSVGGVIPGMSMGLMMMQEGGNMTLYIPADLAYGDQSQPTIPAGSALIFEVELIEVMEGPPAAALPGFTPSGQPGRPPEGRPGAPPADRPGQPPAR